MRLGFRDVASYGWEWIANPARRARTAALPTQLNLPITDNCNSRCVMCDVWKETSTAELTPDALRRVISDRLFCRVRHVGISGGEPSLRPDLHDIVEVLLAGLPAIRSLSITTHGFTPRVWEKVLTRIVDACRSRGVKFTFNLSVDGVGSLHDRVRRIPGGFDKLLATLNIARRAKAAIVVQTTVSSPNIYGLAHILRFTRRESLPVVFRQATTIERLQNQDSMIAVELDEGERSFFADFLTSASLLGATSNPARRLFYRDLALRLVSKRPRQAPCYYQREGVLLDAHGQLYQCSISTEPLGNAVERSAYELYFSPSAAAARERLVTEVCPRCVHDQAGAWAPWQLAEETLRVSSVGRAVGLTAESARMGLRLLALSTRAIMYPTGRRTVASPDVRRAVLIGAYGGEHVGDAAILGGVVQRLCDEHGVGQVFVASTRTDRTEHWVRCLRLPVDVEVCSADSDVAAKLQPGDLLVHAGGPVMDLPRSLLRHLELAVAGRRRGASLVLEGVGIGPFHRATSRRLARRLFTLADETRVRSRAALNEALIAGIRASLVRDPAFDYVERRIHSSLDLLTADERAAIDQALGKEAATAIGINLRPLWYKYSHRGVNIARLSERVIDQLADGMARIAKTRDVRWVCFPMNADQFGFSDIDMNWSLAERAGSRSHVEVIERELGVDAAIYLFTRLRASVAMRFHANVFALATACPALGIDYSIGKQGKVGELYSDAGSPENVRSIELFTADWLVSGIERLLDGDNSSQEQAAE